jgi:hypothetical protein
MNLCLPFRLHSCLTLSFTHRAVRKVRRPNKRHTKYCIISNVSKSNTGNMDCRTDVTCDMRTNASGTVTLLVQC